VGVSCWCLTRRNFFEPLTRAFFLPQRTKDPPPSQSFPQLARASQPVSGPFSTSSSRPVRLVEMLELRGVGPPSPMIFSGTTSCRVTSRKPAEEELFDQTGTVFFLSLNPLYCRRPLLCTDVQGLRTCCEPTDAGTPFLPPEGRDEGLLCSAR